MLEEKSLEQSEQRRNRTQQNNNRPRSGRPSRPRLDEGAGPSRPQLDEGAGPSRPQLDEGAGPSRFRLDEGAGPSRPQLDEGAGPSNRPARNSGAGGFRVRRSASSKRRKRAFGEPSFPPDTVGEEDIPEEYLAEIEEEETPRVETQPTQEEPTINYRLSPLFQLDSEQEQLFTDLNYPSGQVSPLRLEEGPSTEEEPTVNYNLSPFRLNSEQEQLFTDLNYPSGQVGPSFEWDPEQQLASYQADFNETARAEGSSNLERWTPSPEQEQQYTNTNYPDSEADLEEILSFFQNFSEEEATNYNYPEQSREYLR